MAQTRHAPLASKWKDHTVSGKPGQKVASGFLYGIGFLAAVAFWVWLAKRTTGPPLGFIVKASGQSNGTAGSVTLDISVLSQYPESRLFEVAWAMAHPLWTRGGDTLLREVPAGATERFGVLESTPPFGQTDVIQVVVVLFSRPIGSGNPVEEARREFAFSGETPPQPA